MDQQLDQVLRASAGLKAAALADSNGLVLQTSGEVEAESLCALVAMCKPGLERAAELLGLGSLTDWSFTHASGALFVSGLRDGLFVVVASAPTKNPEIAMTKIAQTLGDRR
jgi:predicted regulator of Ras-like GTPase activity (Roadblock/LC7/MglB family)